MRIIVGVIISICLIAFVIVQIRGAVINNYEFENKYENYWQLADKSSTLDAKREYLAKFEEALDHGYRMGMFADYNATSLKTPNNSFVKNLSALRTLVDRLNEVSKMDVTSFQYNTAIEQITKQEQGEAGEMISVFGGCYTLENRPYIWGWIGGLVILFEIILTFFALSLCFMDL